MYIDGLFIWITEEEVHGRYVVCVVHLISVSDTEYTSQNGWIAGI